jgi:HlyD family secretion protein
MKLKTIATLSIAASMTILVAACSFGEEAEPEPVAAASTIQQPRVVSAEAFVVPLQEADLAFEAGGRVVAVEVQEGDEVSQGDLLAQLDDSTQRATLAEAEANLAQAQAAAAVSEASLAEAAAGLAEAEASLAKVNADPTPEDIAQLEANLARAEAALAEVVAGPTNEDIAQAQAAVRTAQAQLAEIVADPREEDLQALSAKVMQAQADVRKAQTEYDRVRYGNPPDTIVVGGELEKATLAYEAAQAELDKLVNGATEEQIATAQARVAEAEAALAKVKAGATPEQIAQAQAEVARAQADLDKLLAGATDEDIAIAEAGVERARANLETARAGLESSQAVVDEAAARMESAQAQVNKTQLTAPFDGTVSLVNVDAGEVVQGGAPVISMGDASGWQIETDDLTEIDVVDVQIGAKVNISVDALPGETFEGKVVRITPKSVTKAGDVTYTVLIDITSGNTAKLRWGMTTFVDIEVGSGI